MTDRYSLMLDFLNKHITGDYRVESLAGDASFRRYHRVYQGDTTYLVMDAPPERESTAEFIAIAKLMGQAVNTPDILAKDTKQGFLLLQDFGDVEFAHAIKTPKKDELYQKALTTLIDLQSLTTSSVPLYDDVKLATEMALFHEWFLPYVGVRIPNDLWQRLQNVLLSEINKQPIVLVHRDYHSRNLMLDKNSDRLGVIDFQDALAGAYTYDLVSLVRDAYIDDDENWVVAQIQAFHSLKQPVADLSTFIRQTNIMGVQRHLKVLGIFVRLAKRDGKERYLGNIPKVMRDLCHEVNALVGFDPVFLAFDDWLQDELYPAYVKVFEE